MRGFTDCRSAVALASFSAVFTVVFPSMGGAAAQQIEQHGKTIKQCNDELRTNAAALEQAHESPATFIHDCWWHTAEGHPTAIRGAPTKAPQGGETAPLSNDDRSRPAQPKASVAPVSAPKQPVIKTAEVARQPHQAAEPHVAIVRALSKRRVTTIRPARPRLALDRSSILPPQHRGRRFVAVIEHEPDSASLPLVTVVPVRIPGLGLERPIAWPVFPAFVPAFRAAVNHPIVPGFTSTP